jgi:hypothetical protein
MRIVRRLMACRLRWGLTQLTVAGLVGCLSLSGAGSASASSWTIQPVPSPSGGGQLQAVACVSAGSCISVGYVSAPGCTPGACTAEQGAGTVGTLVERWDGLTWSVRPSPNRDPSSNGLLGVSCTSKMVCTAVGWSGSFPYFDSTLIERWDDRTWSLRGFTTSGSFSAVSCASRRACIAVGTFDEIAEGSCNGECGSNYAVAARWNGNSWLGQTIPMGNAAVNTSLSSVSCTSATTCMAVGRFDFYDGIICGYDQCPGGVLVERWDRRRWSIQPAPEARGLYSLDQVSCASVRTCMAVGTVFSRGRPSPFAARWNGQGWINEAMPTPRRAVLAPALTGLSCTSSNACTAVGNVRGPKPYVERWNGSSWTVQRIPLPPGAMAPELSGVSCTSRNACIAVGQFTDSSGVTHPLVERSR